MTPALPARPSVLVVDDTPSNIEVLLSVLENDYDMRVSTSGLQALARSTQAHRPDLILLDVMMPDMDGFEVCEALAGNPATRDIPVIFVTARSDTASEAQAFAAGGVDYIHKPIDPAVVRARVALHLELARHRHHLEELVAARTRELAAARDAADSANRAKSAFLSNMSHELRTPMNHIMGFAALMKRDLVDGKARDRLDKIGVAASGLLRLINDLLDLARIESDRLDVEVLDFDPVSLLRCVELDARAAADAKGIALALDVDPALPAGLTGGSIRLGQALGHLVDNAVKYSDRGTVTIRARSTAIHRDAVRVRVEVADEGAGIPPDLAARLSSGLLEQGDGSPTRRHGGTGLGLALVRRLAALMGGETGFASTPGSGSTFWIEVPLAIAACGPTDAPMPDPRELHRLLACLDDLLAADDLQARTLWRQAEPALTRAFGDAARACGDAVEAFDFATARQRLREAAAAQPAPAGRTDPQ